MKSFLISPVFVIAWFLFFSATACAQTEFIYNDDVIITLPSDLRTQACDETLALKAGGGCIRIERGDVRGVLFYRQNEGYALTSSQALEKHMLDSVQALSDIPNITIRNSRILQTSPLLGMIDLLRNDPAVAETTGLDHPPLSQTSILIPLPQKLGQLFIYLPDGHDNAQQLRAELVAQAPNMIRVIAQDSPRTSSPSAPQVSEGTLSLLPQALLLGGAAALLIILILHVATHIRRRTRDDAP